MTSPDPGINMRGAVDLSALANPPAQGETPTGDFIVEATAAAFSAIVEQSNTVPILVELYSARSQASVQLSQALASVVNRYNGKFLLARVNADTEPDIVAAFGVQAIPATVAIVKTQPIPLFQGAPEESQITEVLDNVLQVAAENGVTGTLEGADGDEPQEPEEEPLPPNIQAAYDAVAEGDFQAAKEAYEAELAINPADGETKAGLAQVEVFLRIGDRDPAELITSGNSADAGDLETQLQAADAEASLGDLAAAFSRLLQSVKATAGEDRERVRQRLVDLFILAPEGDPALAQARRDLALALF